MNAPTSMLTPGALTRFQDDFAQAVLATDATVAAEIAALTAQPAFAVYRNTVMKGCIDALQANYPAVASLVGAEWLRAAAVVFVREQLPSLPMLLDYGADFPRFLARFAPAAQFPYLPGVASLDRFWTEAHTARDAETLDPLAVARLTPDETVYAVLHPHPSARWAWFPDYPIYTIWSHNRMIAAAKADATVSASEITWRGEGALLTRPRGAVEWIELGAADCEFLDACAAGRTLAEAAAAALAAEPNANLAELMARLLKAGAFSGMTVLNTAHEE